MALTYVAVAEEALALPPSERAKLAKLLIQSLDGDTRTNQQIKADLSTRLAELTSGADPGLTSEQVFER